MAEKSNTFQLTPQAFILFSLLAGFIFEAGLVWAWFIDAHFLSGLFFHLASSLCFFAAIRQWQRQVSRQDKRIAVVMFVWILAAFFPGIGLIAAAIFYLPIQLGGKKLNIGLYDDYEEYITDKKEKSVRWKSLLGTQQQIRREVGFLPIADIMAGHDVKLKVKAIAKLSKNISRENVHILKRALADPLAEVRMYAASALIKMDQEINDQINLAKQWTQKRGSARDFAQLGNLYQVYTASGLVDETLSKYYLKLTAEAYRQSLDQDTQQSQIVVDYARCLLELKDNERAKLTLSRAYKIWPQDPNIVFLRNETLFRLGEMDQVKEGFESLNVSQLDESQRKVIEFWTYEN